MVDGINETDLDSFITGHWGEDQYATTSEDASFWAWVRESTERQTVERISREFTDSIEQRVAELFAGSLSHAAVLRLAQAIAGVLADLDDEDQATVARCAAGLGLVPDWCPVDEAREMAMLNERGL